MLQAGRSRVRFPRVSFLLIYFRLHPVSKKYEYQRYFLGDKGGRCVELRTLPSSRAYFLEIWEPQPPGIPRACTGIAGNVRTNVTRRRLRANIVAAEKQCVTYSACVYVALGIQLATRMYHITLLSVGCPTLPYSSTFSLKRHDFRKKIIEHKMFFDFFPKFSEIFLILRIIQQDIVMNMLWSSCKL